MRASIQPASKMDLHEVLAYSPDALIAGAEHSLGHCYTLSTHCWIGLADGRAACIWGLIPPSLMGDTAYLWLLTTDIVREHQFIFVRHSQRIMEQMLAIYPVIVGHCERHQEQSIRWLRLLGATFDRNGGEKLIRFVIRKR